MKLSWVLWGSLLLSGCYNLNNPADPSSSSYTPPKAAESDPPTLGTGTLHLVGVRQGIIDWGVFPPGEAAPVLPLIVENWGQGDLLLRSSTTFQDSGLDPAHPYYWELGLSPTGPFSTTLDPALVIVSNIGDKKTLYARYIGPLQAGADGTRGLRLGSDDAAHQPYLDQTVRLKIGAPGLAPPHVQLAIGASQPWMTYADNTFLWNTIASGSHAESLAIAVSNTGDYALTGFDVAVSDGSGFYVASVTTEGNSRVLPGLSAVGEGDHHRAYVFSVVPPDGPTRSYNGTLTITGGGVTTEYTLYLPVSP